MRDSLMRDPYLLAHSRRRCAERIADIHHKAGDFELAKEAEEMADAAFDACDLAHPTTQRGVDLKAEKCIRLHLAHDCYADLANEVRSFFKSRRTIDGAWLRDLRLLINHTKSLEPGIVDYGHCKMPVAVDWAIIYLESILAGMSKPRIV